MTPVPASDQARELLDRTRASLPGGQVREVRMFGVIAVMIDDAMAVAVHKDGSLVVRVDPAEDARLLEARWIPPSPPRPTALVHPVRRWEQVARWVRDGSESRRGRCEATRP
jgi:hypothetical protein